MVRYHPPDIVRSGDLNARCGVIVHLTMWLDQKRSITLDSPDHHTAGAPQNGSSQDTKKGGNKTRPLLILVAGSTAAELFRMVGFRTNSWDPASTMSVLHYCKSVLLTNDSLETAKLGWCGLGYEAATTL